MSHSGKEFILAWCKEKTKNYAGINIVDFTTSWQDGLAFCALINSYHPNHLSFATLSKNNVSKNLQLAFDTAAKLGVPKLLEANDFTDPTKTIDSFKNSILTYLTSMYQTFEKVQVDPTSKLKKESEQTKGNHLFF
jgi:hypothetical protein